MLTLTELVQDILRPRIPPGATVVDATAGNGNDTLFLARCVGESGLVYAFDLQRVAIDRTESRLQMEGLLGRVRLIAENHRDMAQHMDEKVAGRVRAVMFNLGYLPDGDHRITTHSGDTLAAMSAALGLLCVGGLLAVVCYRGHPGGEEEAGDVERWSRDLPGAEYEVIEIRPHNRLKAAPFALIIRKAR